jgi:hypothetical protein
VSAFSGAASARLETSNTGKLNVRMGYSFRM